MTTAASAGHTVMVYPDHRCPCRVAVAVLTRIGAQNMLRMLAGRRGAIVAAGAIARHIGVIEVRRHPAIGSMAALAITSTLDMLWMLAHCCRAVVTAAASADDLRMINPNHRCPCRVAVAVFADIGAQHMLRVFTGRRGAIMAADAIACYIRVIEVRRHPAIGGMTSLAVVAARDMLRILAG